ncbi:MAG: quinone-dependent dihydroorotate dehydrogenase [Proteobacteria bacterium]|nr:quinone-dependent dihydroorotate dehydrogenase [Pseudomonadota bacterium]
MSLAFSLLRPVLHSMDPEMAHSLTIKALASGAYPRCSAPDDARLEQTIFGLTFSNPVGLAAGFDKNAEALKGIFAMGFGFAEAGTVTPLPQEGNPKPRVFRDTESQSVINRMGFPGLGADVFAENYTRFCEKYKTPKKIVGINIGKNKTTEDPAADYLKLATHFAPVCDYLSVNISSPNTPGLRDLQKPDFLIPFIRDLKKITGTKPVLIKLAPDLTDAQITELAATLLEAGIDGIILGNTTLDRPESLPQNFRGQTGGLSGPHVKAKSTHAIARIYAETKGKLPVIGVGGVASATDAYAKIRAGASLVQLYTALVFHGPALVTDIKTGLLRLLDRDGFKTLKDAIGADHK